MAKDKIMRNLEKKGPNALREGIHPVDILNDLATRDERTPEPIEEEAQEQGVEKEKGKDVRKNRTEKGHVKRESTSRGKKPRIYTEQSVRTVLAVNKREAKRYSFEIYEDQQEDIEQVCTLYREATGHYLSASRLIREVLDTFLPDALKAFEKTED